MENRRPILTLPRGRKPSVDGNPSRAVNLQNPIRAEVLAQTFLRALTLAGLQAQTPTTPETLHRLAASLKMLAEIQEGFET